MLTILERLEDVGDLFQDLMKAEYQTWKYQTTKAITLVLNIPGTSKYHQ